jgi:predicted outer membrane repeat protein
MSIRSKMPTQRWSKLGLSRAHIRILIVLLIVALGIWFGSWALAAPPPAAPQLAICTVDTLGTGTYVENVVITRSVAIVGAGTTGPASTIVDGNHSGRVFSIESVNATVGLASLSVTRGKTDYGAGTGQGGGIYNEGTLTIHDLLIVDNQSDTGRGGGIHNVGTLTLTNSIVDFNSATYGGGLYNASSATATIIDSQISGHHEVSYGSGIFSEGTLTVTGCEIRYNSVLRSGGFLGTGGGMWLSGHATIEDSVIHSNYSGHGGGIYVEADGVVEIDNSQVLTNTAGGIDAPDHSLYGFGGGIRSWGVLTITHSKVNGNNASGFWSNQYGNGGGIEVDTGPNARMIMVDTEVISNTPEGIGVSRSGMFTYPTYVEIYASAIRENKGDGIHADGSADDLLVRDSQISDNRDTGIEHDGTLKVVNSEVNNNGYGGIDGKRITVRYSTISSNTRAGPLGEGAGIHARGQLKVLYSTISGNTSGYSGGGIYSQDRTAEIHSSTISGNSAAVDGGGICVDYGSDLTMVDSTVSGNTADGHGGGIALDNSATASLDSVTIADNTADQDGDNVGNGGGIYRYSRAGTFSVANSIVATNRDNSQFAVEKDPDCYGDFDATGQNLVGAYDGVHCTGFGWALQLTGTENNPLDPLLDPLADNGGPTLTQAPDPGSPAVDYEYIASCPDIDQRGLDRPQSAYCDLGAVEIGTCPAPVPCTLSIARDGSNLTLSWTESDDNREYVFYRTTNPFDPYANLITMTTPFLSHTDYGAIGDPQMNYFYRVAGENACGERSDLSNKVGEFDFGITPGERRLRLTMIALPLEGAGLPASADEVAEYIDPEGSIRAVAKWQPLTRSWMVRRVGAPFGTPDFPVAPGDTLFIGADSTAPESFAWVGDVPPRRAITHTLYANAVNFVMVPLARSGHYVPTALGLADDIGGVLAVARWNRNTQRWVIRTASVGTNFAVYPGYPYAVLTDNSAPPSWP